MSETPSTRLSGAIGDILKKLVEPLAEELGQDLLEYKRRRRENADKILLNAGEKLGDKLNSPGRVPLKVFKTVINEGSYFDDAVATEYFGGVLASSRTEVDRDDRGARLAKMIDNMSAYQLRSHYLIYSTISELFSNSGNSFNLPANRRKLGLFMPFQDYFTAMDFTQQELGNSQIVSHIFHGLGADRLIDDASFGSQEFLTKLGADVPGPGIVCLPSVLGAELLLWAFGHGDKELDFLLTDGFSSEIEGIPKSVPNAVAAQNINLDNESPFDDNLEELLKLI